MINISSIKKLGFENKLQHILQLTDLAIASFASLCVLYT